MTTRTGALPVLIKQRLRRTGSASSGEQEIGRSWGDDKEATNDNDSERPTSSLILAILGLRQAHQEQTIEVVGYGRVVMMLPSSTVYRRRLGRCLRRSTTSRSAELLGKPAADECGEVAVGPSGAAVAILAVETDNGRPKAVCKMTS